MKGRGRLTGTLLGLVSMLGASGLAGVTALHVALEHGHTHGSEAVEHEHGHPAKAAESRHWHGARALDHGHARQSEASDHDHSLALVADVGQQSDRARTTLASSGHRLPNSLRALDVPARSPTRSFGALPGARAAPLSRRSVILQV